MAGVYLHIPFCRKKCHYCDFYKTTDAGLKSQFLISLLKEIDLRKNYLQGELINTIFIGGGTPSVLKSHEIEMLLKEIFSKFKVSNSPEITLEANPDDLTEEYLSELRTAGINRLSIGVQSFNDEHLRLMNRRHSGLQAMRALETAAGCGFENLNADLIFGVPGMQLDHLRENLEKISQYPVNHISAYFLTFHKGTRFYQMLKKGLITETRDDDWIAQFNLLLDFMQKNGFEQYEISNFARNKSYSVHNKSYWSGSSYLGLGPSAHSFNQHSRQWNISDLNVYIKLTEEGKVFFKEEKLSQKSRYNEYVMTSLRTKWGTDSMLIEKNFGEDYYSHFISSIASFINKDLVKQNETCFFLTRNGIFISDKIISTLFLI